MSKEKSKEKNKGCKHTGWICPKCGCPNAPTNKTCVACFSPAINVKPLVSNDLRWGESAGDFIGVKPGQILLNEGD